MPHADQYTPQHHEDDRGSGGDGRAAQEFRGPVWQASNAALVELQSQLEELRSKVDIITRDIVQAG